MGIPSETVTHNGIQSTAKVVMSPLIETEEPFQAGVKARNQFYAKPIDGSESFFMDADGMSGGPVFSLKKIDEQWKYNVIGVQSAWYPSTKTLAICPFSSLGLELEKVVVKALAIYNQPKNSQGG